jgi:hypothetical protein
VAWHYRPARVLLYVTAAGIGFYFVAGKLVYPGRFLPYWYLGIHMLAGFAAASVLRRPGRAKTVLLVLVVGVPLVLLNAVRGGGYLRDWSGAAYGGLQQRKSWPELEQLFAALGGGEGRIYWEQAPPQLSALGSRNLAAVTPYIARGQPVVNGLWLESSRLHDELVAIDSAIARARHDARQLDVALGKLSELGVTRLVALTPATAQLLAQRGAPAQMVSASAAIFAVPGKPLIESRTGNVQITEWSDERVRFRTTSPGTPHVVRMSWFPNWRAYGAALERGESAMMLVIPRGRDVELRFERTGVEVTATIISIMTALVLAAVFVSGRRRDRRETAS